MSGDTLANWQVPLGTAADNWQKEYGITALYLNDVAAGALLEIPRQWDADQAVERVASGLRYLLQELWLLDLVRPVLAVYNVEEGISDETKKRLRRLTWDDEGHRGDFALRPANTAEEAAKLLYTLMGDTMGALDENVRADRVGIAEVRTAFTNRRSELKASQAAADQAEGRLIEALLAELDRIERARTEPANATLEPNLVTVLGQWGAAEGGES